MFPKCLFLSLTDSIVIKLFPMGLQWLYSFSLSFRVLLCVLYSFIHLPPVSGFAFISNHRPMPASSHWSSACTRKHNTTPRVC